MRLIDADKLKEHIDKLPALPDGNFAGNHSALKALINMQPTIEQPTNCSEFPNNSDTISRQAAIDEMNGLPKWIDSDHGVCLDYSDVICVLGDTEKLPSAQPEIIRCRNCKFASGDSRICMKFGHSPIGELDFCAWAERRTDG